MIGIAYVVSKRSVKNNSSAARLPKRDFPLQWKRILEDEIEVYQRLERADRKKF